MKTSMPRNYIKASRTFGVEKRYESAVRTVNSRRESLVIREANAGNVVPKFKVIVVRKYEMRLNSANRPGESGKKGHWDGSGVRWNVILEQFTRYAPLLEKFRKLRKGWDSYDAEPLPEICCDTAERILKLTVAESLPIEFITPTSDSSILIKHKISGGAMTWEIDDDGEIGVMIEKQGLETQFASTTIELAGSLLTQVS